MRKLQLRGMPGGIHGERWQHRPYDTYLAMGTPFALLPHWPVATLSLQVGSLSNLLRALQLPALWNLASLPPSGFLSLGHPSCDFCCCYCSVTELCPTLCDPMDCSTPGVLSFTICLSQAHVHWVGGAIQPLHPLSSPSPPAFSLSQHQSLSQWVGSLNQVVKVSELQHQSFQWRIIQSWFPLGLTGLQCKGLSRVFSSTRVWKHQFFSTQPSVWSNSHIHTWLLEKL